MIHETKPRLGFLGIGLMGSHMTFRLLDAGYDVCVWNRTQEKILLTIASHEHFRRSGRHQLGLILSFLRLSATTPCTESRSLL